MSYWANYYSCYCYVMHCQMICYANASLSSCVLANKIACSFLLESGNVLVELLYYCKSWLCLRYFSRLSFRLLLNLQVSECSSSFSYQKCQHEHDVEQLTCDLWCLFKQLLILSANFHLCLFVFYDNIIHSQLTRVIYWFSHKLWLKVTNYCCRSLSVEHF